MIAQMNHDENPNRKLLLHAETAGFSGLYHGYRFIMGICSSDSLFSWAFRLLFMLFPLCLLPAFPALCLFFFCPFPIRYSDFFCNLFSRLMYY